MFIPGRVQFWSCPFLAVSILGLVYLNMCPTNLNNSKVDPGPKMITKDKAFTHFQLFLCFRTDILPNVTLGFEIFDSCNTNARAVSQTLHMVNSMYNNQSTEPRKQFSRHNKPQLVDISACNAVVLITLGLLFGVLVEVDLLYDFHIYDFRFKHLIIFNTLVNFRVIDLPSFLRFVLLNYVKRNG